MGGSHTAGAERICGSSDLFKHNGRKPYHSINFVTAHDGFTLKDLLVDVIWWDVLVLFVSWWFFNGYLKPKSLFYLRPSAMSGLFAFGVMSLTRTWFLTMASTTLAMARIAEMTTTTPGIVAMKVKQARKEEMLGVSVMNLQS